MFIVSLIFILSDNSGWYLIERGLEVDRVCTWLVLCPRGGIQGFF